MPQAKIGEVTGLDDIPGICRHNMNLSNRPGKKKIQAIFS